MISEQEVQHLLTQAIMAREDLLNKGAETTNKVDGIIYALTLVLQDNGGNQNE